MRRAHLMAACKALLVWTVVMTSPPAFAGTCETAKASDLDGKIKVGTCLATADSSCEVQVWGGQAIYVQLKNGAPPHAPTVHVAVSSNGQELCKSGINLIPGTEPVFRASIFGDVPIRYTVEVSVEGADAAVVPVQIYSHPPPKHSVRMDNVDDRSELLVNDKVVAQCKYKETRTTDLTPYLTAGRNTVVVRFYNAAGGATFGYKRTEDGTTRDERHCGDVGTKHCGEIPEGKTGLVHEKVWRVGHW